MQSFTVVGFWPDTGQRFSTFVCACSPDLAEAECQREHPGLAVCGVIQGEHPCVESADAISCEATPG